MVEDHDPYSGRHPQGPNGSDAPGGRRRWWLGLVSVVVVVGVLAVGRVVEVGREDARRAELAEIPGVLPHMERPLEELWRARIGDAVLADDGVAVFADTGLLRGVDLAASDLLWSRDLGPEESGRVLPTRGAGAPEGRLGPGRRRGCSPGPGKDCL